MLKIAFAAILAAAASAGVAALPAPEADTYIKAGRFFDGRAAPHKEVTLLVTDGKVARVGNDIPIPPGAHLVDLSNKTVLPGLIDAHTHIALHAGGYDRQILRETPEFRAIWAGLNARKTLEGGVTTIRDLGNEGAGFADLAIRDAIAQGLVPGPRIVRIMAGR